MSGKTMLKMSTIVTLITILIGFSGCTQHLVIEQYPMKPGMVPEFRGGQPVALVNAQTNKENVNAGSASMVKYTANTHQVTDTAIQVLKTELEKRNISTSEDAEKQLRLAIQDVTISYAFNYRCILHLRAETGDGYVRDFEGNNDSWRNAWTACGGAVLRAVAAMLNDDTILGYLKH
jgi:CO/xanthine dehydrogenase Mo-binding subunit